MAGCYLLSCTVLRGCIDKLPPEDYTQVPTCEIILKCNKCGIGLGGWRDEGRKEDLLEANRNMLDIYLKRDIKGETNSQSQIVDRVEIRQGTKVENSLICGPTSIAEDCQISNSRIGPFTP